MKAPAKARILPPPVGGWDTQNALADMPAQNAVVLDNWFPTTDKVIVRRGHEAHATGMTGNIDSLLPYTATDGTQELFAGNGSSIFDVKTPGAVGAAVVGSLTNVRFQYAQIGTAGGNFLIAVNGADTPITFNGTAWSTASITGPTAANLAWINLHQRRLWFGERDSLTVWYLPVNSIAGAAASFNLAAVAKRGGYIMAMGTWTRDAGDGADDVAVFITSEGEAIVYQGTDPSSLTTWALVGVFTLGPPIGRRCFIKAGADLVLITEDGFVALSTILSADRSQAERVAISAQINKAVNDAVQSGATLFGWEPFIYPRGTMLIFNVPQSATVFHQYVFSTITNAPCRFTGLNARCWALLNDAPYFGGTDGKVYKFDTGASDNGANIVADAVQAFNDFGVGSTKAFKGIETLFLSNGPVIYSVGVNIDYRLKGLSAPFFETSEQAAATWGSAVWGESVWGDSEALYRGWRGLTGIGYNAAIRLRVDSQTVRPAWVQSMVRYVPGGLL